MEWNLRPASESDRAFLYALHCRTMRDVIEKTWGWDDAWQRVDFERRFRDCVISIIESDGHAAGSLWLDARPDSLYIVELQLLPEMQGKGIGTSVVQGVLQKGEASGVAVTLSVVPANARAQRFYEGRGFEVTAVDPPFIRMERRPSKLQK